MNVRTKIITAVGVAAVVAGTGVAVTSNGADPQSSVGGIQNVAVEAPPKVVDATPALFNATPAPDTGFAAVFQKRSGLQIAKAVGARTNLGTATILSGLRGGTQQLCFIAPRSQAGGCIDSDASGLKKPYGQVVSQDNGSLLLAFALPAGVEKVSIESKSGDERQSLAVSDGVAAGEFKTADVGTLRWVNSDGSAGADRLATTADLKD